MSDLPLLPQVLGISLEPIRILDIGALFTGTDRYERLERAGFAQVTGVELNPDAVRQLKEKFPARTYIPYVLGDGKRRKVHFCRYAGCTSLYAPEPEIIERFAAMSTQPGSNFHVLGTEEVKTVRLDDIQNLPAFDFVKIDVQGAELDVLKGGARSLDGAALMEIETEFVPIYKDQPLFADIDVLMRSRGYFFHKFVDLAGRCYRPFSHGPGGTAPLSQLLWADSIYVREFSRLDKMPPEAILKTATLLHEIYRSYDLAGWLLQSLDRRQASRFAETYLAFLQQGSCPPPFVANLKTEIDSVT